VENIPSENILQLGRNAADAIGGDKFVTDVGVAIGEDSMDRPVYHFSFLVDQNVQPPHGRGLFVIRLSQRLKDDLAAQGDARYPIVHFMNQAEWKSRAGA
jgi:hypothetical protein